MVQIFVAYPSNPHEINQTYSAAKQKIKDASVDLHLWVENDVCGRPLTDPIFDGISNCDVLLADVTKLNFNVTFEIGYAIGRGKQIKLLLNSGLIGDSSEFGAIGIFDTLGFETYENADDIRQFIANLNLNASLPTEFETNTKAPIYIVEMPQKNEAMTRIISQTKKTRFRYRSFSVEEHIRLSASDAISKVSESLCRLHHPVCFRAFALKRRFKSF
jgi:hypothetical protein